MILEDCLKQSLVLAQFLFSIVAIYGTANPMAPNLVVVLTMVFLIEQGTCCRNIHLHEIRNFPDDAECAQNGLKTVIIYVI